jgi:multidrug transporter EmrE-like cation transporter
MKLNEQELMSIEGGVKYSVLMTIGAIGVFIVGVIDGIFRPLKCNK